LLSNSSRVSNIISLTETLKIGDDNQLCKSTSPVQHISKTQKRRDKKEKIEKQRLAEIEIQRQEDKSSNRNIETSKLIEILKLKKLELHDIPSNGDCLFAAICHQEAGRDIKKLRQDCVERIRSKKKEYLPFLNNSKTGEMLTDIEFDEYCTNMANTNAWGGQIELHAISDILGRKIEVLQAEGSPIIIGENANTGKSSIILTYHRYYLALGEHYNSTISCT